MMVPARVRGTLQLAAPMLFLGLFFAYPLALVLRWGLDAPAWEWLAGDYVQGRIQTAFLQAILSVLVTLALAIPLAWHHHRRAIPFGRIHLALHAAPFVLPVFVVVGAMREIFGPHGWLAAWTGTHWLAVMGPLWAVVLAHAYYNYGLAARLIHSALERRPHRLEEAARTLGASPRQAILRVSLPLLAPAILAVALLVFLFSFTSFGVVLFLGQGQIATLETLLYENLPGIRPRYNRAAALGILQLAINVLLLLGYFALRRRSAPLAREPRRARLPARHRDHIGALAALALGLTPALAVLVGGFRVDGAWSLEAWRAILDANHPSHEPGFNLLRALDRSIFYALWSAALALLLTLGLAYGAIRVGGRTRRIVELIGTLPIGTSSLLVGLGTIFAFGAGSWLDLRGTLWIILVAHALVALPFVARTLVPALDQHDTRLDEAAALLGASPWQVWRRIHWPLLRGPLAVAAGFAIAISLGDFGASLILMREDNMALSVWIGNHATAFRPIMHAQMVALSGVLMLLSAAAYVAVERFRVVGEGEI